MDAGNQLISMTIARPCTAYACAHGSDCIGQLAIIGISAFKTFLTSFVVFPVANGVVSVHCIKSDKLGFSVSDELSFR